MFFMGYGKRPVIMKRLIRDKKWKNISYQNYLKFARKRLYEGMFQVPSPSFVSNFKQI